MWSLYHRTVVYHFPCCGLPAPFLVLSSSPYMYRRRSKIAEFLASLQRHWWGLSWTWMLSATPVLSRCLTVRSNDTCGAVAPRQCSCTPPRSYYLGAPPYTPLPREINELIYFHLPNIHLCTDNGKFEFELFDVRLDPFERTNLIGTTWMARPSRRRMLAALQLVLQAAGPTVSREPLKPPLLISSPQAPTYVSCTTV